MDTIRLRTLTEKSIIGFGQYADLRVKDLISMNRTRDIRWIYYNCSMISFMPDILRWARIEECDEIEKPGVDRELYKSVNEYIEGFQAEYQREGAAKRAEKRIGRSKMTKRNIDKRYFSKGSMQSRNHGH